MVLPRVCLSPRHVKVSLIWSMPSACMKQRVFLVYTEPSTMRIGEAGFEQFINVISFRATDAIFPRIMYIFCHRELSFKTFLTAKNRDEYVLFLLKLSVQTSSYLGLKKQNIVFLPVAIIAHDVYRCIQSQKSRIWLHHVWRGLDKCKSKHGASVSEVLALFNCNSGARFTKLFMTELIHKTELSTHFCPKLCSNFITF